MIKPVLILDDLMFDTRKKPVEQDFLQNLPKNTQFTDWSIVPNNFSITTLENWYNYTYFPFWIQYLMHIDKTLW